MIGELNGKILVTITLWFGQHSKIITFTFLNYSGYSSKLISTISNDYD